VLEAQDPFLEASISPFESLLMGLPDYIFDTVIYLAAPMIILALFYLFRFRRERSKIRSVVKKILIIYLIIVFYTFICIVKELLFRLV
jgi:hypothetical protein